MILICSLILLFSFIYLLFSTIVIDIDTTMAYYSIRFGKLLQLLLLTAPPINTVELKIAFWRKRLKIRTNYFEKISTNYQSTNQSNRKTFTTQPNFTLNKVIGIVKSFKLTRCNIILDTGNMPLNGFLFPWFYLLSIKLNKVIGINFNGRNSCILQVKNSIAQMLWAYIKA